MRIRVGARPFFGPLRIGPESSGQKSKRYRAAMPARRGGAEEIRQRDRW